MRSRAFSTLASAFSLLLLVATAVLWVQSHRRVYALFYHADRYTLAAVVRPGSAEITIYRDATSWPARLKLCNEPDDIVPNGRGDEFVNYMLFRQTDNRIPLWLLVAIEMPFPLTWTAKRLRVFLKHADGEHCPTCSYNLTANTSGICPECGTAVVRGATTYRRDADSRPRLKSAALHAV